MDEQLLRIVEGDSAQIVRQLRRRGIRVVHRFGDIIAVDGDALAGTPLHKLRLPRPLRVEQLSEEDRNSRGDDLLLRAFELQRTEALRRARGNRPSEGRDWGELFDEAAKQSNLAGEEGG